VGKGSLEQGQKQEDLNTYLDYATNTVFLIIQRRWEAMLPY